MLFYVSNLDATENLTISITNKSLNQALLASSQ